MAATMEEQRVRFPGVRSGPVGNWGNALTEQGVQKAETHSSAARCVLSRRDSSLGTTEPNLRVGWLTNALLAASPGLESGASLSANECVTCNTTDKLKALGNNGEVFLAIQERHDNPKDTIYMYRKKVATNTVIMGNSYAGQLKTTRFEEVLHNSIEASLRSNNLVPRPIFSQLYLEAEQQLSSLEAGSRVENEEEEEEEDDGSESNSPPLSYQMKPVPEGCCTIDGFCQAGKDLRLVSICSEPIEAPPGFLLVGAKSPNLPEHLLVCAVDKRFLPDDNGHNALLGFSGNCVGCGEKGFRYFTEFSNHINLKLTTQPKKQKHLKYYLIRNAQGLLVKGCLIYWKGTEMRGRQPLSNLGSNSLIKHSEGAGSILTKTSDPVYAVNPNIPNGTHLTGSSLDTSTATVQLSTNALSAKDSQKHQQANKSNLTAPTRPTVLGTLTNSGPPKKRHKGWSPESPTAVETINVISTVSRNKPEDTVSHYVQHTPIVPESTRISYGQHSSVVPEGTGTPYGQHSSAVQEGTGAPYVQHSSVVPESAGMAYLQHPSVIQEGIGTAYVHLTSSVQEGTGMPYLQHSSLGASLPSPMVASGEPVSVPDNLLHKCMSKPVIFKGHGNFPYLCGNLNDIIVSPLLTACYRNSQSIPKAYEQYGASAIIPISEEMQLLLTVYYLVQLASDQIPLIEDLEQIFMRSWRESHLTEIRQYPQAVSHAFPQMPNYLSLVTTAQLPWLAGLAASSCNESVKIIECSYSLAEGLSEMFKLLIEGKLEKTNYVVMMCATRARSLDSCIAVTGKHQSRVLAESMLTPVEYLKEVNFELMTGRVEILGAFFSTLCPEDDIDVLLEKFFQENQGHISPSLNTALSKSTAAEGNGSATCTSYSVEWHEIRPSQIAMAQKLLSHICSIADSSTQNLDLGSFEKVDFLICVPPSEVTYQQTLFHLVHSGVLMELGLEEEPLTKLQAEQYVMKLDSDAQTKFKAFLHRSMQNPHTLFILIHDHAHWDLGSALHSPYPHADTSVGLVDRLLNCREVKDAPNIVVLHVTSFPYALQTQYTHVSPYNEIHWPPLYSHGVDLYQETKKYFGLSEFIDSTMSGHSLPMLRYDSSFEAMIMTLAKRFPKLHSAVIRTFVLIQHYSAALMVVCGLSQMKNYTSVETLEIIQNLLNSPRQCTSGHGLMVLLRVPCVPLATLAYERLCHVREKLALADQFEILLGNPAAGLSIGTYFVEKLKTWQKIDDPDWQPQTYLELEGLPCILIFSGMDPQGESLPRSLRYCDLRLVNSSSLVRTSLEQELGLASYFLSSSIPSEKGVTSDVLESDPEKLSSTDNEDEELVTEGSTSDKRSPATRERSHSQDSGSSSMSSKASSSAFCGELSVSVTKEDTQKSPSQTVISSPEDNALSCGTVKADKHGLSNASKQCSNTGEMVDISNSAKQNVKPSSISTSSSSSSSSSSPSSLSTTAHKPFVLQTSHCIMIKAIKQPPVTFLPKLIYDIVTSTDSSGLPKSSSLLPHHSVMWASSFRPLLTKMMTSTEQSLYYRQWTLPKQIHMDYSNRGDGRMDTFHPRRLLLSGPSQIGKTGAYLQFLSILSRMLIRLTEVDVYDEEEINTYLRDEIDPCYHQPGDEWPDCETFKKMPFDYTIHDPKYEDASLIWSNRLNTMNDETLANRRQEDMYLRRQTTRIRLSKYAAYNTYHHCEQCYQYMGFNPKYPLYESTLHAFSFSYSMIGEEVQLHFIIPKSKEHHFTFSQPGGQLESMRLPLVTDKNPDYVRSPIFTPTTGRHEHGLFNLYHAMDGAGHLHILVVKEYEMAIYKKYWPNHIMLVLPSIFNSAGVGAAHFLIKELSYHNLELERNRQGEFGVKPQDIWPFIIIADDSCVMWNTVDVSNNEEYRNREHLFSERNVSFKCVLQHMEALPNITHYALLGMRKWSSKTKSCDIKEPFSRCHLHDFILLNVDLTQNVQYNQNRFTCNDVDFNLRAHSSGLLICRFNRFSVMKKHIAVGGHRSFHIKPKMCDTPMSISPAQYICAPDSKHTFLAAPAQLLLEKYLQYNSHRFFSLSLKAYRHPVLSVDCYLNLGPQIAVCYVSSRPHSINISCSALIFSGLVLHLCDSFLVASFLKQFNFLKGATLCVISQDRNSLRQLVARLELEEEWQFRLRDEFQTANAKQDHPLFFLTGRHI